MMTKNVISKDIESGLSAKLEKEITFFEYLRVIIKYKRVIIGIVTTVFVLSVIIAFLLPKTYTASASILPPTETEESLSSILTKVDSDFGGLASNLMGNNTTAELYAGILRSRTIIYDIIDKFDLIEIYDVKFKEDALKKLLKNTQIEVSKKDKIIKIFVNDRNPQRAADITNTYLDLLDQIIRKLNVTESQKKRAFLEKRMKQVKAELEEAEFDVKRFQEEYRAVAIEEQARVSIESAAKIQEEMLTAQTELEILKKFGTERQNEAVILKAKIEEFQKQLEILVKGNLSEKLKERSNEESGLDLYIPFYELPEVGMNLGRLTREAKVQEKIFELITAQYELAKIDEAKDVKTIRILDEAITPERKTAPKRTRIVIVCTIFSLFASVLLVFGIEYVEEQKKNEK